MSDTSVALISSGAALAASAITGCLTWLAGRSNLVRQLIDQKEARHEQHRREVYTVCLESLSALVIAAQNYGTYRIADNEESYRLARDEISSLLGEHVHRVSALHLVGPESLAQTYERAHNAILEFVEFMDLLPPSGFPARPADMHDVAPYLDRIGEAVERFGRDASLVLGFG
ncbi:hypothetical protein GR925_02515 [Streptomyces sp. HUCO-GS316]|uniref:hypothetical protein n=1 Tax=Streptomyces sp. HUCO-GS316 TaxID=2692198 RepID=UPI00136B35D4|nr:hypothetical protein [Streptomyces sp. HUCO-GS316]MXM62348.1 hypothetical protein [Streptomyces sp. HUCO-GS316]